MQRTEPETPSDLARWKTKSEKKTPEEGRSPNEQTRLLFGKSKELQS